MNVEQNSHKSIMLHVKCLCQGDFSWIVERLHLFPTSENWSEVQHLFFRHICRVSKDTIISRFRTGNLKEFLSELSRDTKAVVS